MEHIFKEIFKIISQKEKENGYLLMEIQFVVNILKLLILINKLPLKMKKILNKKKLKLNYNGNLNEIFYLLLN